MKTNIEFLLPGTSCSTLNKKLSEWKKNLVKHTKKQKNRVERDTASKHVSIRIRHQCCKDIGIIRLEI